MPETCSGCGKELREDEIICATDDGFLSVTFGEPWCDECLPGQPSTHCIGCGQPWQDAEDDLGAVIVRFNYGEVFKGFACKKCGMNPATGKGVEL